MPATGYITVRTYASFAQLPLKDAAITVTDVDGNAIAMRLTDRNGKISPIPISVPEKSESQEPYPDTLPYRLINLHARKKGYELFEATDVQVFAGIVTNQELEMIPLEQVPNYTEHIQFYDTPPQNL